MPWSELVGGGSGQGYPLSWEFDSKQPKRITLPLYFPCFFMERFMGTNAGDL